ncbi:hypothetical protein SAMN05216285_1787 [Natrinema salifodinae]|uniref:Uncharacterized protein n=1 Tax=Natrinema salifodinae TaxID=1202768 RepID=A0A1I0NJP8_9EURY|nr:hypothetical protein SAMN05216285_1787 [Natrinema salifodinae]
MEETMFLAAFTRLVGRRPSADRGRYRPHSFEPRIGSATVDCGFRTAPSAAEPGDGDCDRAVRAGGGVG